MVGKTSARAKKKAIRFGFVDLTGRFVIPAEYEDVSAFFEGLAAVKIDGKWGYIDRKGKMVVKPQYTRAEDFSNGFALVDTAAPARMRHGVPENPTTHDGIDEWRIDRKGKRHKGWTGPYVDGIAVICLGGFRPYGKPPRDGKWGLVDLSGKCVLKPDYRGSVWGHTPVGDLSEGLAAICVQGGDDARWFYVDRTGKKATPDLPYFEVNAFSQGRAGIFKAHVGWGFIDRKGKAVGELGWDQAYGHSEGLARVWKDKQYGFVGLDGKLVIPCRYAEAGDFHCGRAAVQPDGDRPERFHIDPKGRRIGKRRYTRADDFAEDRAVIGVGGPENFEFGLIDPQGKEVVPPRFDQLESFENGGACCSLDGKWGYLGKNGAFLIEPRYDRIGSYLGEEVAVNVGAVDGAGGKWGFVDRHGKELIPPTFDSMRSRFFEGLAAMGVLG